MPNILTKAVVEEYEQLLGSSDDALFVQPVGMTVEDVNAFRGRLAGASMGMQLLKGSLARRVLAERGLTELDSVFEGPAAVITALPGQEVEDVAVAASKVLASWRKDSGTKLPVVKGGLLEGEVLDADAAARLEKMPARAEMRSILSGQIIAVTGRLASQLVASGGAVAGAIATHRDRLEKAG